MAQATVRHGSALLGAIIAVFLWPTVSWAAEVSVVVNDIDLGEVVQFVAAPGETINLEHSETAGVVTIRDPGATLLPGSGCIAIDIHEVRCTPTTVPRFGPSSIVLHDQDDVAAILSGLASVWGGDGDDTLSACDGCWDDVFGEAGNDLITGGGGRFSFLAGGSGADVITGGSRAEFIRGGPGNDALSGGGEDDDLSPGGGDDVVNGGSGDDSVTFDYFAPKGVDVSLPAGTASGQGDDTLLDLELVYGTSKADRLVGDAEDNFLNGGGGMDTLIGGSGNDSLYGGAPDGRRTNADWLWGGLGNDKLQGIDGDDLLVGGGGRDLLLGGTGNDRFGARDGIRDRVKGEAGVDRGRFDRASDTVTGVEIFL